MNNLINLNTKSIKKAIKASTGLTARVHKVKGEHGIRIAFNNKLTSDEKESMQQFFAEFNIVNSNLGSQSKPYLNGYSYSRLFAIQQEAEVKAVEPKKLIETNDSFNDYWANSASQSVINDHKSGNVNNIYAF